MSLLTLSQINIYPIKSLGGISVESTLVEARGLQLDRRWMLVDERGQFLTQRSFAKMALLQVSLLPDGLQVTHKIRNIAPLHISFSAATGKKIEVTVWEDTCSAILVGPEADNWFSEVLNQNCRLVYMPDATHRAVDPNYALADDIVSFADAYPVLLIGQESLTDLNSRLPEPVPMNRFRPNLVFTGGAPFTEDTWDEFTINEIAFKGVKRCARCVLTTINQNTATKSAEPLRTLARYRTINNKVLFGQNVLPLATGKQLKVGDTISVKSFRNN